MTDQKSTNQEKEQIEDKEKITTKESSLETLAKKINNQILEEINRLDRIKAVYEEEFDRKIIHEEIDPRDKAEDHLQIAAHIRNLVDLLIENPENINQLREIAKTIFWAFHVAGDKALQMVLPIIETFDSRGKLTSDEIKDLRTTVYQRTSDWLEEELGFLVNKGRLSVDILEKVVKDIR